jgi:hypothetical protein
MLRHLSLDFQVAFAGLVSSAEAVAAVVDQEPADREVGRVAQTVNPFVLVVTALLEHPVQECLTVEAQIVTGEEVVYSPYSVVILLYSPSAAVILPYPYPFRSSQAKVASCHQDQPSSCSGEEAAKDC